MGKNAEGSKQLNVRLKLELYDAFCELARVAGKEPTSFAKQLLVDAITSGPEQTTPEGNSAVIEQHFDALDRRLARIEQLLAAPGKRTPGSRPSRGGRSAAGYSFEDFLDAPDEEPAADELDEGDGVEDELEDDT